MMNLNREPGLDEERESGTHPLRPEARLGAALRDARQKRGISLRALAKRLYRAHSNLVEYELGGNLTISDSLFSVEAALEGIALAYTFEQLALPHIKTKKLKRVLMSFSSSW